MKNFTIRKTKISDLKELNKIYFEITGSLRSFREARWEWFDSPYKNNTTSWVILNKNKEIIGHHGYIKVPLSINKKLVLSLRTENSMLKKKYRKIIPYFFIENSIFNQNKNKFHMVITSAGVGAQLKIRERLNYKNIGSWNFKKQYKLPNFFLFKILSKLVNKSFSKENKKSVLLKIEFPNKYIRINPSLKNFTKVCINNLSNNLIEAYPAKEYLNWRFFKNPYHKYFKAVIKNFKDEEEVAFIWYEINRGFNFYDVILEYVSTKNKNNIDKVLQELVYYFNKICNVRIIYRSKQYQNNEPLCEKKNAKILIYSNYFNPDNKKYYFDSFIRQGFFG